MKRMCWELLVGLLCLADFIDTSSSIAGDKRLSPINVPSPSRVPRCIELGAGQNSVLRSVRLAKLLGKWALFQSESLMNARLHHPLEQAPKGISHRTRLGIRSIVNERTESASKTDLGEFTGDRIHTESRIGFGIDSSLASGFGFMGSSGGNSAQPGGDPGTTTSEPDLKYLIVKVDLVSPNATNISTLIEPLQKEVEQLLATGFPRETFQVTWLTYE